MKERIDELLAHIRALQAELDSEYRQVREEWARKKAELAEELACQQRRYRTGLLRYLLLARLPVKPTGKKPGLQTTRRCRMARSHLQFFPEEPSPCDGVIAPPQSPIPTRGVTSPPPDVQSGIRWVGYPSIRGLH